MVTSDAYLQELLRRYQANFDVTENYKFGEILFPAYAFFHSMSEKYVLRKEAQLWAVKTFEHVFFIKETSFSPKKIDEIKELIIQKIEPEFVRKNEKYPEKDHMIQYVSRTVPSPTETLLIFISDIAPFTVYFSPSKYASLKVLSYP